VDDCNASGTVRASGVEGREVLERRAGRLAAGPARGADSGPPPGSNTGGKLTTAEGKDVGRLKIDWLTLVFPASSRLEVVERITEVMGKGEDTEQPRNCYRSSWRWETGAVLAYSNEGLNCETCCLNLSGSTLDFFTAPALRLFMQWAASEGATCSRLDLAFDDHTRELIPLAAVHEAAERGDFSGFKVHEPHQRKTRRGTFLSDGRTFGQRGKNGGGRQVVFYDKTLESRGEIDAIRLEARHFKDVAQATFAVLVQAPTFEEFCSLVGRAIAGSINFLDRSSGETHLSRCPLLPWWSNVVQLLGRLRVRVSRPLAPFQQSLEHRRDVGDCMSWALLHELAESQGMCGDTAVLAFAWLLVQRGKAKLDAGKRPGARSFALDFDRLLCA
jgi:hypothetical protein